MKIRFNSDDVIRYLIELKGELVRIQEERYQKLIALLQTYEINDEEDNYIPNKKELASKLMVSDSTIIDLIKKLYHDLMYDFMINPLKIENYKQSIHIHIPYDEEKPEIKKKYPNHYHEFSTFIDVKMPFIPRVGEKIEFRFLEYHRFITSGYVNNVEYRITGNNLEVYIEAHPFDNEYARWEKLKVNYEDKKMRKTL